MRIDSPTIRDIRLKEEELAPNGHDEDEDEEDAKENMDGHHKQRSSIINASQNSKLLFQPQLTTQDFETILSKYVKDGAELGSSDVEKVFPDCLNVLYENVKKAWEKDHSNLPIKSLENFYSKYSGDNLKPQCQKFLTELTEKTQKNTFDPDVVLSTFNSSVVNNFAENLSVLKIPKEKKNEKFEMCNGLSFSVVGFCCCLGENYGNHLFENTTKTKIN
ncbi:hypothetical protein RFI_24688 [Reticulomyxa filosa]|uniref:Uncharacterized protein n=1 Tax=Reticulomyxa filosa TaxID=46433 RepID=X6MHZ5_RETFI|nr:hypothetical protein RFI_24688 [Reticulomyxa filosa]|eukprot:ETO12685.1 hypothetical protein RFI_24688 [Reticulomyxa filosa]